MKISILRILICLIVLVGNKELSAQGGVNTGVNVSDYTQTVDILPPSPNASSIGKYGGLNTNLSSGMINTEIPIYEYRSTNITVPIALRYSSNGTRIDEIAGRVGMGWSLEAGGVVTRTVMGRADDKSTRTIPTGFSSRSDIDLIAALCTGPEGTADAQPDMFSFNFNGNSGKFMLDSSLNPILLTHSGLQIQSATDANGNLTFKFITVDGVQYCFDDDSAMEMSSKRQLDCGHSFPQPVITAWYLSRIIHPDHDTVSFTYSGTGSSYKPGIFQSIFQYNPQYTSPECSLYYTDIPIPSIQNSTCLSWLLTYGGQLTGIHSSGGASVEFDYGSRTDGVDDLLTGVKIYQPGAVSPCKVFTLQYQEIKAISFTNSYSQDDSTLQYRPFLTGFTEQSPDGSLTKNYSFYYNDPGSLAPRLSYAQDDYGFFNGKNNKTMIPKPADVTWQQALPSANADRSSDVSYASKGMLTKIVYPTGGQDSIMYESNTVYGQQITYKPAIAEAVSAESDHLGGSVTNSTPVFHVYFDQQTLITGSCQLLPGQSEDVIHDKATISLTDVTTEAQVFSQAFAVGASNNPQDQTYTLTGGHDYQVQVTVTGMGVTGAGLLQYIPDTAIKRMLNLPVGGVRVQKMITRSDASSQPIIKHYFYNRLNDTASSGSFIQQPVYQKALLAYVSCSAGDCHCSAPGIDCQFTNFQFYSMYSNSLNTVYLYSGTPVCYNAVIESEGDNFENGGTLHEFFLNPDNLASPVLGDIILGAPMTSFDWESGKETHQYVFKYQSDNFIPVKQIFTHYNDDSTVSTSYSAYVTNKKYQPNCQNDPPDPWEVQAYDVSVYLIYRKWLYADSIRTLTYDGSGISYVEQDQAIQYANKTHALPTQISRNLSDTRTETVHNYYPTDLALIGDPETARQNMIAQHILSPMLKQQVSRGTTQTLAVNTNYHTFGNGLVLPSNYVVQTLNNAPQERVDFSRYNAAGKIAEQYKTNDQKQVDIWDYHNMYLIAQAVNADSASVAFTSFEADGSGNWSLSGGSVDPTQGITGRSSYQNGTISKSGLNASTTYIVSYWSQNGAYNITGTISGYPVTGKTVNFSAHPWTLYTHRVTGQTTITVNATGHIDELRLYPSTAQMTTYTYDPLIGMTSHTDAGNRVTYYEYDGLLRLKRVRDQDYNILKTIEYAYQAPAGCGNGCYSVGMQTFAGTNTLSYPVGVFDIHGNLLGNATNAATYVSLWNNDTADAREGTLAAGSDSMHFNFSVNAGQPLLAAVTGCRYYQYDLDWNIIDGIRNLSGAYVDFGDGTGMRLGKNNMDTPKVIAPNTTYAIGGYTDRNTNVFRPQIYFIHSYSDTALKTLTFYHNDDSTSSYLDNINSPATSLNRLSNLRGNLPQNTQWIGGSSYENASAMSVAQVANWNSISSVFRLSLQTGDGYQTNPNHVGYSQDFMKNNKGLQVVWIDQCIDTSFKMSRLKSDWNTYFTQIFWLSINDNEWNREDLSPLTNLRAFGLSSTSTNGAGVIDSIINQIATGAGHYITNGSIGIGWPGYDRTAASANSYSYLKSRGWTILINGVYE